MEFRKIAGRIVAAALAGAVTGGAGWAQTQVQPPTNTRPQSAQTSNSSPTSKDAPPRSPGAGAPRSAGTAVPQSSGGGPAAAGGPQTATVGMTILNRVQQAAQAASADLDRIRIDKWKTDSSQKQQMQQVAQSLTRNLQSAVPELIQKARAAQTSVAAQFTLYHDLSVVYEFYNSLAEAAGAFGTKQEYEPLAQNAAALDQARQSLSDYIQNLATQNDAELAKLRAAAQQQAQTAAQQQQKKVVVDDEQASQPPKKKNTTKKKSSSATVKTPQNPQ